jgi:hypothetical protein
MRKKSRKKGRARGRKRRTKRSGSTGERRKKNEKIVGYGIC